MQRKIIGIALLAVFAVMLFPQAGLAKTYRLNYSWFAPITEPHQPVVEWYIEEINKRTNGQVEISYFPSGSLVAAAQAWDAVEKGVTDMDFVCMTYTPKRFPLVYAWSLPLGIKTSHVAVKVFTESYEKFQPAEMSKVKVLYCFGTPPMQLHTIKKLDTDNLDSMMKGVKVRCNGIMSDYMALLGATPVGMPSTDTYESMQKGVVDANVIPSQGLEAFKLGELAKYEYTWNLSITPFVLVMNQKRWDNLPDDIKQVFEEVSAEARDMEADVWEWTQEPGRDFGRKFGMEFYASTPEIDAWLKTKSQPLIDAYLADLEKRGMGAEGREFLQFLMDSIEKHQN